MTIQSIEQVLDGAIALLMYGSSAWLSYSLAVFIVTRSKASVNRSYSATKTTSPILSKELASEGSLSIEVISEIAPAIPTVEKLVTMEPLQAVATPPIICEPVNWKKWKVGDLRQVSITQVCHVKTRPIESSHKLKKADLIAQYEQNLKRMTYERPAVTMQSEKIA